MKSIIVLLLISLAFTFFLAVCYWIPRHLFFFRFTPVFDRSLIPGQQTPLPQIPCRLKKGCFHLKVLTPSILSLENDTLSALTPGKGTLFVHKRYGRKWAFGLITVRVSEKPVFFRHKLLVHALGGLENQYTYCNALEGLEQSLEKQRPFLETDMILTSDGHLVCSHGWKKKTYLLTGVPYPSRKKAVMSYETFMNTKIHGKFTTIDAGKIAAAMKEHPALLVELDLRTLEEEDARKTAGKIVEAFEHRKDLINRLLIQIGSPEMYEGINSVYPFPNYQYFVHKDEAAQPEPVIDFCVEKGILSVALRNDYFSLEIRKLCRKNGICILVYTVDDAQQARDFLASGADAICSNFLTPEDLEPAD